MAKKFVINDMIFARLVSGNIAFVAEGLATLCYVRSSRRFEMTKGNDFHSLHYDHTTPERLRKHWEGFIANV